MATQDPHEQEAAEAAAEIKAQNSRMICNECSHVWTIEGPKPVVYSDCPECGSDDTISEADMLADQAERGLPA